jgi:predicted nucleic acid-binding protein
VNVLVDTPVWSLALRRRSVDLSPQERLRAQALHELVIEGRAQVLGATRQEVLSGIRDESVFRRIRNDLRAFSDVSLEVGHYEEAARMSNQCRGAGVTSTSVDMLICAVALHHGWQIFTTDRDFKHYAAIVPIRLFLPI